MIWYPLQFCVSDYLHCYECLRVSGSREWGKYREFMSLDYCRTWKRTRTLTLIKCWTNYITSDQSQPGVSATQDQAFNGAGVPIIIEYGGRLGNGVRMLSYTLSSRVFVLEGREATWWNIRATIISAKGLVNVWVLDNGSRTGGSVHGKLLGTPAYILLNT